MTSTRGSQSSSAQRISGAVHQPFRPTATAPRLTVAQKVISHSAELAPRMATRSPFLTP
jgi:hypothetical protein